MRIFLLSACLLHALNLNAQEAPVPKWGVLLPAVSLTSDYRFNGMSLSNRGAALQGSLHLWRPDGYYAGIWVSEVDFLDGETSLELDTYLGRNFSRGDTETSVELMYTAFNDDAVAGPTYDFLQLKTGVKRRFDAITLGAVALWSPSGSAGAGRVMQLRSEAEFRMHPQAKLIATLGRRWADIGADRSYWDIGFKFEWRKVDLDLRYSGTNLDKSQCFYTDWCEAGFYVKATLASY